mgnify:CR=1 FL=1
MYRKDYSIETKPKLLILDSLFKDEFSIVTPSGSKISIIVEWKRVQIIIIHYQRIS